jgi:multiple sugar transport system permease protein
MSASTQPTRRSNPRQRLTRVSYYLVASIIALVFVAPLLWTALRSLQGPVAAAKGFTWDGLTSLTFDNYVSLNGAGSGLFLYTTNSLIIGLATMAGTVIISTLAGYALAKTHFPGQGVVFLAMLVPFMVPFQGILVPLFTVLSSLHLTNSLVGLILVYITFMLPFSVFVMRNSFLSVPSELEEAAVIDGASTLQLLWRIFVPLVIPGIATTALYAFLFGWSELLAALIFMTTDSRFPLPVALGNLQTSAYGKLDLGVLEAGAVAAMVPCILLFVFLQRYYLRGLAAGAVKL